MNISYSKLMKRKNTLILCNYPLTKMKPSTLTIRKVQSLSGQND